MYLLFVICYLFLFYYILFMAFRFGCVHLHENSISGAKIDEIIMDVVIRLL